MKQKISHEEFTGLFLQSEREVYRYVMSIVPNMADAQDVVQETAVALWRKRELYDSDQPFTPWACRFALNEAREFIRRKSKLNAFMTDDLAELICKKKSTEQSKHKQSDLLGCVAKLEPQHKSLIEKYYFKQVNIEKISGTSGRSAEALYKSLQRIRRQLLACMRNQTAQ
jgi:RNA polymerase sigma-70 factor (ECF subfamily)